MFIHQVSNDFTHLSLSKCFGLSNDTLNDDGFTLIAQLFKFHFFIYVFKRYKSRPIRLRPHFFFFFPFIFRVWFARANARKIHRGWEFFTEQMKPNWKGERPARVLAQIATQLHSMAWELISTNLCFNASFKFRVAIN